MLLRSIFAAAVVTAASALPSGPAVAQFQPQPYRAAPDQDRAMNTPQAGTAYDQGSAPYPYEPSARGADSGDPLLPRGVGRESLPPLAGSGDRPAGTPSYQSSASQTDDPYPIPDYSAPPPAPGAPYNGYANRPAAEPAERPLPPGAIPPGPSVATPGYQAPAGRPDTVAALPPEDQPEIGEPKELPPQFKRQIVPYQTKEPAGTIIVDTPSTFLYYVLGDGTAVRYGIGVGREGFTWTGTEKISRLAEWPDWHPPAEMIERQPYLPRFMAGGEGNPLGARALYLGKTIYRIHGTNQPSTIGKFVSSGCIRMLNEDVIDLYSRVKVGTRVVVRPGGPPSSASSSAAPITR